MLIAQQYNSTNLITLVLQFEQQQLVIIMKQDSENAPELNSMMRSVSAQIGDFQIKREINKGSSAHVFHIKTVKDHKSRALKTIWKRPKRGDCKEKRDEIQRKVANERRIHQSLRNRYIVQLHRYFKDADNFYFILQYCDKGDLSQFIKQNICKQPIQNRVVKEFGLQIARGLSYLHQNNIIHGDLKPQNILITGENEIKLCDFEHSVKMQHKKIKLLRDNYNRYVAPEIIELCTQKIDIWSFGCILYELTHGKTPFSFTNLKEMGLVVTPVSVSNLKFKEDLSKELLDLLRRMLIYDPTNRISIDEVLKHPFFTGKPLEVQHQVQKIVKTQKMQKKPYLKSAILKENVNQMNIHNQMNMHTITFNQNGDALGFKPLAQLTRPQSTNKLYYQAQKPQKKGVSMQLKRRKPIQPFTVENIKVKPIVLGKITIKVDKHGLTRQQQQPGPILYINISPDGKRIIIKKSQFQNMYLLQHLPQKYIKIYQDCRKIVQLIKDETPKLKFVNNSCEISIMINGRVQAKIDGVQYSLSQRDIQQKKSHIQRSVFDKIVQMRKKLIEFNESL